MKIGIYLGAFSPTEGGGFTFQDSILQRLIQHEQKSFSFTLFYYGESKESAVGNLRVVAIKESIQSRIERKVRTLFKLRTKSGLQQAIEREGIDAVWFTSFSFELVEVPFIYTVWDLQHRLQPWFPEVSANGQWDSREKMYQQALGRASFVLTGTEAGKSELKQFYNLPESRIKKLFHPVPEISRTIAAEISDIVPINWVGNYWFYPAQFWAHKNHIRILLALRQLNEKHNQKVYAVFCGSDKGNLIYLKEQAQKLGVADQVLFLGFVSLPQLVGLYRNAFALVFPTFFGPENLPPLEAFSLGCPVLASKVEGANEQLGDAAILFDPLNEIDIIKQYFRLKNEPGLREQLIVRGKHRASVYTTSHYVDDIFKILNELDSLRITWS